MISSSSSLSLLSCSWLSLRATETQGQVTREQQTRVSLQSVSLNSMLSSVSQQGDVSPDSSSFTLPVFVRDTVVEDGLPAVQTELVSQEGVRQVELEAE